MIRPQMTGHQAEALAAFLVTLRPGQRTWTKTAVVDALTAAAATRSNDTELLARAAIRVALTANIRTPDVIPMAGAHWDGVGDYASEPPRPSGRCDKCHGLHDDGPDQCFTTVADHRPYIEQLRAQVRPTKTYEAS